MDTVVAELLETTPGFLPAGFTADQTAGIRKQLQLKGRELAEQLSALMAGQSPHVTALLYARPGETPIETISAVQLVELPWMDVCTACSAASRR